MQCLTVSKTSASALASVFRLSYYLACNSTFQPGILTGCSTKVDASVCLCRWWNADTILAGRVTLPTLSTTASTAKSQKHGGLTCQSYVLLYFIYSIYLLWDYKTYSFKEKPCIKPFIQIHNQIDPKLSWPISYLPNNHLVKIDSVFLFAWQSKTSKQKKTKTKKIGWGN